MFVMQQESEDESVAYAPPEPEVTEIAGLADLIAHESSMHTPEEKCQIAQEFYWAVLQILDRDNDGMMSIGEFEMQAETLTGLVEFGRSESLIQWLNDNAIRTSARQARSITSREILETAGHSDLTDADYHALDILIYYSDAFYSIPAWDGDGIIMMTRLTIALHDLADAL